MSNAADEAGTRRRVRLVVAGVVQGVGFRYATVLQAQRLNLNGWVRNRSDGTVEVLAEGEASEVSALAAWCRMGPRGARVISVRETEELVDRPLPSFDVRY